MTATHYFLILLGMLLASSARAGMEAHWWSMSAGGESTVHHDSDPVMFDDAHGRTASLYASAGQGSRWLAMAGYSNQELEQNWWDYRGITRMGLVRVGLGPTWGLETLGWSATGFQDTRYGSSAASPDSTLQSRSHSLGAGGGVVWCPGPYDPVLQTFTLRVLKVKADPGKGSGMWAGELTLSRADLSEEWATRQQVGLLGSRSGQESKVAGVLRVEASRGRLGLHLRGMAGQLDSWYEPERLIVHDGMEELRSALSGGISWQLWKGLGLELGAGQDHTAASRSRWAFASMRWTHQVWVSKD